MPEAHSLYCEATCIWPHECVSISKSFRNKLSCAPRAPGQVEPPNHSILLAVLIHLFSWPFQCATTLYRITSMSNCEIESQFRCALVKHFNSKNYPSGSCRTVAVLRGFVFFSSTMH